MLSRVSSREQKRQPHWPSHMPAEARRDPQTEECGTCMTRTPPDDRRRLTGGAPGAAGGDLKAGAKIGGKTPREVCSLPTCLVLHACKRCAPVMGAKRPPPGSQRRVEILRRQGCKRSGEPARRPTPMHCQRLSPYTCNPRSLCLSLSLYLSPLTLLLSIPIGGGCDAHHLIISAARS